jgi:hypothetical protein
LTSPLPIREKVAIACAGIPFVVGTSIYLLWRYTYWDDLEAAGMLTIAIGTVFSLLGGILILFELLDPEGRPRSLVRKFVISTLLVANFPIAGMYIESVGEVRARYFITVVNHTGHDVASFLLISDEGQKELGPIVNGQEIRTYIHFSDDACIRETVTSSSVEIKKYESTLTCHNDIGDGIFIELQPDDGVQTAPIKNFSRQ